MKRKLFLGLLLAVITLSFFGCSNNDATKEDKGKAPELKEAFFFENYKTIDTTDYDAIKSNKVTDMVTTPATATEPTVYGVYIQVVDPDLDVEYLQLSWNKDDFHNFNEGYPYKKMPSESVFICSGIVWEPEDNTNGVAKPYYLRVKDSKGNVSNVLTVNIKISPQS